MLVYRFARCSAAVDCLEKNYLRIILFKALNCRQAVFSRLIYCTSFNSDSLWNRHKQKTYSPHPIQQCFQDIVLWLPGFCTTSVMFKAWTDFFSSVLRKEIASLLNILRNSSNGLCLPPSSNVKFTTFGFEGQRCQ